MFISKHYAEKVWPNHERRSAQARALSEEGEYVLPARFDNTPVPGLLPTVSYIDLSDLTPSAFAQLVEQKIGRTNFWEKEAETAAEYAATHWFSAHRGAVLWMTGVSAVFANDNGMLGHSYIRAFRTTLNEGAILAEGKSADGYTTALHIDSGDTRTLFENLWACFGKDYIAGGGHETYVEVQSNEAFVRLHSYFDTPVTISRLAPLISPTSGRKRGHRSLTLCRGPEAGQSTQEERQSPVSSRNSCESLFLRG
jgi:hypothetical protein